MAHTPTKSLTKRNILLGVGGVLIVLAVFIAIQFDAHKPVSGAEGDNGHKLLASRESLYNNIYVYQVGDYVSMTFGYNRHIYTESIYNTRDERDLPVEYTRYMTESLVYPKNIHSILEIGFGGGRTAWYLHKYLPDATVTSVELDPEIVNLAHQYFGIKDEPNFNVVNEDGRLFLANSKDRYDIILIDAYRGPFVPFHLLTKEFYQLVKDHLSDGGVMEQNVEPSTMLFDSAVMTVHSIFPNIDFYRAEGNVAMAAYDGPARDEADLKKIAAARQAQLQTRFNLEDMLKKRQKYAGNTSPVDANAKVLTDDFAPVESLKAIEVHNRKWSDP